MARVNNQTIIEVWDRQEGVCAVCGDPLSETAYENHHLLRVADGGANDPNNIVLLCDRDEHLYAHGGDFTKPIQTTEEFYPYFYGKSGYEANQSSVNHDFEQPEDIKTLQSDEQTAENKGPDNEFEDLENDQEIQSSNIEDSKETYQAEEQIGEQPNHVENLEKTDQPEEGVETNQEGKNVEVNQENSVNNASIDSSENYNYDNSYGY